MLTLTKPDIGAPCNGCGLCCQTVVCSCGSYVLGLVEQYGDRANGPCPALVEKNGAYICGLVERPKGYIASDRSVSALRNAVMKLIGAGAGCDEAGDEADTTALPKIEELTGRYIRRVGVSELQKAAAIVYGGIK